MVHIRHGSLRLVGQSLSYADVLAYLSEISLWAPDHGPCSVEENYLQRVLNVIA